MAENKLTVEQSNALHALTVSHSTSVSGSFFSQNTWKSLVKKGLLEPIDGSQWNLQLTDTGRAYATERGWLAPVVTETPHTIDEKVAALNEAHAKREAGAAYLKKIATPNVQNLDASDEIHSEAAPKNPLKKVTAIHRDDFLGMYYIFVNGIETEAVDIDGSRRWKAVLRLLKNFYTENDSDTIVFYTPLPIAPTVMNRAASDEIHSAAASSTPEAESAAPDTGDNLTPSKWLQREIEIAQATPRNMRDGAESAIVELAADLAAARSQIATMTSALGAILAELADTTITEDSAAWEIRSIARKALSTK